MLPSLRKIYMASFAMGVLFFAPVALRASASLQNYTGATCGAVGVTVTVEFQIRAAAWQTAQYSIAFSSDTTPAAADSWVAGNCSTGSGISVAAENATPVWKTVTISVVVPGSFAGGYLLILAKESFMNCSPDQQLSIPFTLSCFTPTPTATRTATPLPTPTRTPTPALPLTKSSNVGTIALGSTLTFCIAWSNDSSGAITRTFYDQLATQFTWVGGDAGCSAAGQLVTCSFAAAAYSSGSKCFWARVSSTP